MVRVSKEARDATRARLLEVAAVEFARVGLDAANINAISLAAGYAKGTVYNYFPSKDALFAAVVGEACSRVAIAVDDTDPNAPMRDRLHALVAADVAWAGEHDSFARVLNRELLSGDPARYQAVVAGAAPYVERVAQVLGEAVDQGEVRTDRSVEQLALVFAGLGLMALAQHWGSDGGWPTIAEIPDLVVDLFVDGLQPPATEASVRGRGSRTPTGHERLVN